VSAFNASRHYIFRKAQLSPEFDRLKLSGGKIFYLCEFFPGGEEAVPLAMIDDLVRDIFRDPGKLSQFSHNCRINIDFLIVWCWHKGSIDILLDALAI